MEPELTPEEKFNAESAETMVPKALLAGKSEDSIVSELVRLDWSPEQARALVRRVASDIKRHQASPESRAELRKECHVQVVLGLFLFITGSVVLIGSFFAGNLFFEIPFCAIITGLVILARGYSRWRLYRRDKLID